MVQVEREYRIGEWRVHVHDVADDQWCAFMAAQHTGGECPRHLQLADILCGDLIELRIALVVVGDRRHYHVCRILLHLDQVFARRGLRGCGSHHQLGRKQCARREPDPRQSLPHWFLPCCTCQRWATLMPTEHSVHLGRGFSGHVSRQTVLSSLLSGTYRDERPPSQLRTSAEAGTCGNHMPFAEAGKSRHREQICQTARIAMFGWRHHYANVDQPARRQTTGLPAICLMFASLLVLLSRHCGSPGRDTSCCARKSLTVTMCISA